jgi:hypothetical protein
MYKNRRGKRRVSPAFNLRKGFHEKGKREDKGGRKEMWKNGVYEEDVEGCATW